MLSSHMSHEIHHGQLLPREVDEVVRTTLVVVAAKTCQQMRFDKKNPSTLRPHGCMPFKTHHLLY